MTEKLFNSHFVWYGSVDRGNGTNAFPIDLNTNILENTTPFLRIVATLVYRFFELVNSKLNKRRKTVCSVAF